MGYDKNTHQPLIHWISILTRIYKMVWEKVRVRHFLHWIFFSSKICPEIYVGLWLKLLIWEDKNYGIVIHQRTICFFVSTRYWVVHLMILTLMGLTELEELYKRTQLLLYKKPILFQDIETNNINLVDLCILGLISASSYVTGAPNYVILWSLH